VTRFMNIIPTGLLSCQWHLIWYCVYVISALIAIDALITVLNGPKLSLKFLRL